MERRSQDRKVRSLAQWSRASEESLGNSRGVRKGRLRTGCREEVLGDISLAFCVEEVGSEQEDGRHGTDGSTSTGCSEKIL